MAGADYGGRVYRDGIRHGEGVMGDARIVVWLEKNQCTRCEVDGRIAKLEEFRSTLRLKIVKSTKNNIVISRYELGHKSILETVGWGIDGDDFVMARMVDSSGVNWCGWNGYHLGDDHADADSLGPLTRDQINNVMNLVWPDIKIHPLI